MKRITLLALIALFPACSSESTESDTGIQSTDTGGQTRTDGGGRDLQRERPTDRGRDIVDAGNESDFTVDVSDIVDEDTPVDPVDDINERIYFGMAPRVLIPHDQVHIVVIVQQTLNPVIMQSVEAVVLDRSTHETRDRITLYDDGEHADLRAGDGVWATLTEVEMPFNTAADFEIHWSTGNEAGIKIPSPYPSTVEIEPFDGNCQPVFTDHNSTEESRINIVVVRPGYGGDLAEMAAPYFEQGDRVGGFLTEEPMRSNADRFNFWYVNAPAVNLPTIAATTFGDTTMSRSHYVATACPYSNRYVFRIEPGDGAGISQYGLATVYHDSDGAVRTGLHELGHAVFRLFEEYARNAKFEILLRHPWQYAPVPNAACEEQVEGEPPREIVWYACDHAGDSQNECYRVAPWRDLLGNGCGEDGVIDCPDDWTEVGCYVPADSRGRVGRATENGIMRFQASLDAHFGPVDERIMCWVIEGLTGGVGGSCLETCLDPCPDGEACIDGACVTAPEGHPGE